MLVPAQDTARDAAGASGQDTAALLEQLDSIRRQIAAQFPGIERELEALDHGALPGTVGHESSARERPELNPSAHSDSPGGGGSIAGEGSATPCITPRRKLAPLPRIFQTAHDSPALSAGWGPESDLNARIKEIVMAEVAPFIQPSSDFRKLKLQTFDEPGGLLSAGFNHEVHGSTGEMEGRGSATDEGPLEETEDKGAEDKGAEDDEDWSFCAENAYGAFINKALTGSLMDAMVQTGPMVVASVLIQAVFSLELAISLNSLVDPVQGPLTCGIPWDLQFAAIMVYLCLMLNNVTSMVSAANLSLFSPSYRTVGEDGSEEEALIDKALPTRIVVFIIAVLTELTTWTCILAAGCYWIITAPTVDLVIRSTVSIMFVQNVDEIIYESCCGAEVKEGNTSRKFKLMKLSSFLRRKGAGDEAGAIQVKGAAPPRTASTASIAAAAHDMLTKSDTWEKWATIYGLYVHLPMLASISFTVVYLVRNLDNMDCFPYPFTGFGYDERYLFARG